MDERPSRPLRSGARQSTAAEARSGNLIPRPHPAALEVLAAPSRFEPLCGPDSPMGRASAAINAVVATQLESWNKIRDAITLPTAPLAAALEIVARRGRELAGAQRGRLDVSLAGPKFTLPPGGLHF